MIITNLKRIARLPHGPTMEFVVPEYSTQGDVREFFVNALKMPYTSISEITEPPLVVLNNFNTDETHVKLMAVTFQNMFPPGKYFLKNIYLTQ